VVPTAEAVARVIEWTAPARRALDAEVAIELGPNGTQRALSALAEGASIADIYRGTIAETRRTYAPAPAPAQ
jgi:hypothetical protein